MIFDGYVACICEGSAEQAIMELFLDSDKLTFTEDQLLDGEVIRCRNAKNFEERYLRKGFESKVTVLRILDSRKENFKLSKAYSNKVAVINVITAPEIEILIIISEGQYDKFKKSRMKPSDFCKSELKLKNVKSYEFVRNYFSNIDKLTDSIKEYKKISKARKNEATLYDLIKE